jgi:hypothetical protein
MLTIVSTMQAPKITNQWKIDSWQTSPVAEARKTSSLLELNWIHHVQAKGGVEVLGHDAIRRQTRCSAGVGSACQCFRRSSGSFALASKAFVQKYIDG